MAELPLSNPPIGPLGLLGDAPVPSIETRTEEQYFSDINTPTGTKPIRPDLSTPAPADPFAGFEDAGFDQFQDAPDQFANFQTADDLDLRSTDELDKDREGFNPVDYFSSNPDAANDPAKLKKLLDVYRKRREEGLTASGVAKAAIKETPGLISGIAKGAKNLAERAVDIAIQPTANVVLGALSGDLFDEQSRAALFAETRKNLKGSVGEVQAGTEAATVGLVDLTRQGIRKLPKSEVSFPGRFTPPGGAPRAPKSPPSDQELLAEISADASFRQNAADILRGGGEAAKQFGLDAETLSKEGITVDPEVIETLSLVDPLTLVVTGGAFKLVGPLGKVVGTARNIAGAEKLADGLTKLAKTSVGRTIQGAGKLTTIAGRELRGAGTGLATVAGVTSALSGAGTVEALGTGLGVKMTGKAARFFGPKIESLGKGIAEGSGSAGVQRILGLAESGTRAVAQVGEGAVTGIAAASPFAIAADEDATAGALFGAGAALGAGGAVGAGAFRVVKNSASRRYFGENRPVLPDVASPSYGFDAALDSQHEANISKLSVQDASELKNFREALRQQGGEIYAVDQPTFRQKVAEEYRSRTGEEIDPALIDTYEKHSAFFDQSLGDRKVVYLNSDTTGLQHDAGHIFDAVLSPEKRAELRTAVEQAFTPEQRQVFRETYERRVGSKISDTAAVDEFIAEQFSALFNNVPVTELNAPKSLLNKFIDVAAEGAEALGIDLSAGATTPNLGAPVSVGIRQLFRNAAGEVMRANIEGVPATKIITPDFGGTPPPPTPAPAPRAPGRPIRPSGTDLPAPVTPEARVAAAARFAETGIEQARLNATSDPVVAKSVEDVSVHMESGNPVLEIDHLGIVSEGTPDSPEGRTSRRATQAAGYEALKGELSRAGAPADLVASHLKTFVPVRWTQQGGTPTLVAMSLDKALQNIQKLGSDPKAAALIPYPTENGKLTAQGWRDAVADLKAYAENQANGRRGDGGRLTVPEAGELSIPVENPAYAPQLLSPERADFQNLIMGLGTPETARRAPKGRTPGNVKGQILAEANLRPTEIPARIAPRRAGSQAFVEFPPRTIQEVNPLRNRLKEAGVNTKDLIEVTERIRAIDIERVTPRPDISFKAPVTDIIRGGFLPAPTEFRQKNLGGRTVEEFSDYILKASPEEWKAATDNMTGGLTGGAWNLGLGLKDAADVGVLKAFQDKLSDATKAAMKSGDFDGAYSLVSKGQFFREAHEAATGTGSAGAAFKRGTAGMESAKPPFPTVEKTQATAAAAPDSTTITIGESGAQFLPAEELAIGTAESRPPELRVLPAAPGGRPPVEPPGLRPPPVAAGFLPAEELQPEETPGDVRVLPAAPGGRPPTGGTSFRPPPVAAAVAVRDEPLHFQPKADEKIQDLAKSYASDAGIAYTPRGGYAEINPDLSKRLADFYEAAKSNPNDPAVKASYDALIRETEDQGKSILAAGYKIEPWTGEGEPYKNSAEAIADVRENKHLFFRQTAGAFGSGAEAAGNPMLAESSLVPGQSVNDVFRWVHDFFGHSKEGYQFGPRGEFNAWRAHSEMYSPDAQGALAAETLAQNSWVNFGPQAKDLPLAERPFAEQKNVVVPKELLEEAGFQPRTESGRKLEERGFEIVPTGELGIRRVAVTKNGQEVAVIQSVQRSPKRAEISMVQKYSGAPRGVGEVLYREIGSQLRDDGVTSLSGQVVSPEPLAIRRKVFGDFASLDLNGEPATVEQALATAERIQNRTENEVAAIEPINTISDATRFLPEQPDLRFIREGVAAKRVQELERERRRIISELPSAQEKDRDGLEARLASVNREAEAAWSDFTRSRAGFQPGRRDAQGRPLKKNGDIDYVKWQAEGLAARRSREAEPIEDATPRGRVSIDAGPITGWILPDKKFVPLNLNFHEQYLAENASSLNEKFNTSFSDVASPDERLAALNAGFVRLRNQNGQLRVEVNARKFPSVKSKLMNVLQDREGQIDGLTVSLLNDQGVEVDSTSAARLHELSGPEKFDKISEAIDTLRSGGFLPADEGLPGIGVQSVEEAGRARAARRISTVKKNNPEAVVPQYARNEEGQIIIKPDGSPKALTLDYDFANSALGKEAAKGLKGAAREEAIGEALGQKLTKLFKDVEKNPDIKAGAKWYSTARTRLRKVFGDDSKFFAELLGATSARTPVEINFRFALDAYNQFKAGAYDTVLAKYREGKAKWEAQDLGDFKGETRGQFMDFWVRKHDLGVTQSSGAKFGMNSRAVLRVLDGSWASEVQGPKTPNFAGNLTGETFEATIDVWAARLLHRLANEDGKARWRILPENETGVTDADFYLGQAAYRDAATKLGIKPDALQAVLWFAEKDYWEKKGWTRGAGAEKSDFNVLLAEVERVEGKLQMKSPQLGLDLGASMKDIVKKKK